MCEEERKVQLYTCLESILLLREVYTLILGISLYKEFHLDESGKTFVVLLEVVDVVEEVLQDVVCEEERMELLQLICVTLNKKEKID